MLILCVVSGLNIVFINKFNNLEKATLQNGYLCKTDKFHTGKMTIRMITCRNTWIEAMKK